MKKVNVSEKNNERQIYDNGILKYKWYGIMYKGYNGPTGLLRGTTAKYVGPTRLIPRMNWSFI